jgi:hypothetical protein
MTTRTRRAAPSSTPPIVDIAEAREHYNIMLYSDPGVGKTVFAASHPGALVLAVDKGTISAARQGSKAKMWVINDWSDFEAAQKWVRAGGYKQFEWIVLDSFTMLREKLMKTVLEDEHARNSARDEYIPAQPDHQKVQNVMKRVAERFIDLPVHFLATGLPMVIESRDGEEKVYPMIHGQKGETSIYIAGLFDSLGYMEMTEDDDGKTVRRIHWEPYEEYTGKDRFDVLKPYTDNLTLSGLQKRIEAPVQRRTATPTRRRRATTRRSA